VILKANGEKAEGITVLAMPRLLAAKGATVALLLSRGREEREVQLVLPDSQQH
jgi:hypothetical protein